MTEADPYPAFAVDLQSDVVGKRVFPQHLVRVRAVVDREVDALRHREDVVAMDAVLTCCLPGVFVRVSKARQLKCIGDQVLDFLAFLSAVPRYCREIDDVHRERGSSSCASKPSIEL